MVLTRRLDTAHHSVDVSDAVQPEALAPLKRFKYGSVIVDSGPTSCAGGFGNLQTAVNLG